MKAFINEIYRGTNLSALSMAILMNNQENVINLIQNGALSYFNGNSIQKDFSPIFLACDAEKCDILEIMCDNG